MSGEVKRSLPMIDPPPLAAANGGHLWSRSMAATAQDVTQAQYDTEVKLLKLIQKAGDANASVLRDRAEAFAWVKNPDNSHGK